MKTNEQVTEILGYLKSNRQLASDRIEEELRKAPYQADTIMSNRANEDLAIIEAKIDVLQWVLS